MLLEEVLLLVLRLLMLLLLLHVVLVVSGLPRDHDLPPRPCCRSSATMRCEEASHAMVASVVAGAPGCIAS